MHVVKNFKMLESKMAAIFKMAARFRKNHTFYHKTDEHRNLITLTAAGIRG